MTVAVVTEGATQVACGSFGQELRSIRNCNRLQVFVCSLKQHQPPDLPQPLAAMEGGALCFLPGFAPFCRDRGFVPRRHSPAHGISAFKATQEAWAPETGPPKRSVSIRHPCLWPNDLTLGSPPHPLSWTSPLPHHYMGSHSPPIASGSRQVNREALFLHLPQIGGVPSAWEQGLCPWQLHTPALCLFWWAPLPSLHLAPCFVPALLITVVILGCLLAVPGPLHPDPIGFPTEVAKTQALREALTDHGLARQGAGMKESGDKGVESPLLFPLRRTTRRKYWKEGREIAR